MSSDSSDWQRTHSRRVGPRAMQACRACAASKTKCDNNPRCRRCVKRNTRCIRQFPLDERTLRSSPPGNGGDNDVGGSESTPSCDTASQCDSSRTTLAVASNSSEMSLLAPTAVSDGPMDAGLSEEIRRAISYADWDLNLVQNRFHSGSGFSTNWGIPDTDYLAPLPDIFGLDSTMPDGNGVSMYLDDLALTSTVPAAAAAAQSTGPFTTAVVEAAPSPNAISPFVEDDKSDIVTNAFRRATARWVPAEKGNFQAEEERNLTATHGTDITALAADPSASSRWDTNLPQLPSSFPLSARDRLLAMMASACQPADVPHMAATFPSPDGLNSLVRSFLAWHMSQEDTWIHVPTVLLDNTRVELLAGMVAAGAVRSPSRAVQKFGLAVQEVLQMQLRMIAQKSPIITRDRQYLQALALEVQVGFWSGNKRKMEIAGGTIAMLIQMLRSGGRFRRFSYTTSLPAADDYGPQLEERWKHWLEQESMIRIVHHVNIHSSQDALISTGQPPFSLAELTLPFPQQRALWFARSAAAWKETYFRLHAPMPNSIPLTIIDCLADHSRIHHLSTGLYDMDFAQLSVLHGVISQKGMFRHLHIVPPVFVVDGSQPTSRYRERMIPDEDNYRDMIKAFVGVHRLFRLREGGGGSDGIPVAPPTIMLMLDLLLMYFHCSIEQLELLAGREGFVEAKTVYASLRKSWFAGRDGRHAAWQAGQVIRRVRDIPPEAMNDFHSLALYHASLCLWTYGMMSRSKSAEEGEDGEEGEKHRGSTETQDVVLDGEETLDTERWIAFGRGRPVLTELDQNSGTETSFNDAPPTVVSLRAADAIMQTCIQTIRKKYPSRVVLPPSTESFCYLIHALGLASRKDRRRQGVDMT